MPSSGLLSLPTAMAACIDGSCRFTVEGIDHHETCLQGPDESLGEARLRERRREEAQRTEPRERSEPAKRLARERVGESEGRSRSE